MASQSKVARRPTKRKKSSAKTGGRSVVRIPQQQLGLPAGYTADGKKLVPLRDVISPDKATIELSQLSPDQQARLTAERIRRQRRFRMGMVGVGVLNKKRAIEEVNAQSDVGQTLVEIENRALRMLIEQARKTPRKKRSGGKTR